MLSPQCVSAFGSAREQFHLRAEVTERLSLRTEKFAELVRDVNRDTSEAEAKRIFALVSKQHQKIVSDVESELRLILGKTKYNAILELQLGLVGLVALEDDVIADWLGLDPEQREKIREAVREIKDDFGADRTAPETR